MARFRRKTCITLIGLILFIFGIMVLLKTFRPEGAGFGSPFGLGLFPELQRAESGDNPPNHQKGIAESKPTVDQLKKGSTESTISLEAKLEEFPVPNYNLHVFYYSWYGSPQFDGKYIHWDHPVLPHWDPKVATNFPKGRHSPPDDVGSNFYPALGAYSSRDPSVIEAHMQQLRTAAIGVLALSWHPPGMKDDNGEPTDDLVQAIMDIAHKYQVKVTFHIEPYKGRDDLSMYNSVKYIVDKYGDHPAFYRYKTSNGKHLPLFYVYDSYLTSPEIWTRLLKDSGHRSVRNTAYDGIFIGLLVEEKQKNEILTAGFDGLYTYFATNGFSYGSSHRNWKSIKGFCDSNSLMFIPSVGPGYIDTSIRPWNFHNTRNRINGKYYETALSAALEVRTDIVSITSFNEWHEGTQIEKAIPKTAGQTTYQDYLPHKADIYLEITRKWAEKFQKEREKWLV
ncbi:glycoprotein endo-alpha-1,2-mannosidase [Polyodon spathula]|uniref:glycoprotein endo-alpha-1,2-mannosidase n=1 Tax=Polyodon spathula TaxID=7913 RepID=UPI001B7E4AD7|nr:glycoprotein endo-alpha-1,2-mannosidase [Polyodon spathula]XP_041105503.1 glycoprotein endo-alpha-1,2-mannosidase [Polyodon spathula]